MVGWKSVQMDLLIQERVALLRHLCVNYSPERLPSSFSLFLLRFCCNCSFFCLLLNGFFRGIVQLAINRRRREPKGEIPNLIHCPIKTRGNPLCHNQLYKLSFVLNVLDSESLPNSLFCPSRLLRLCSQSPRLPPLLLPRRWLPRILGECQIIIKLVLRQARRHSRLTLVS